VDALLLALTVALAALGVTLWLLLRPYSAVSFTPFQPDRDTYRAGETVTLSNTFCWDGTPFTADRWLVSAVSENALGTVRFPDGYALDAVAVKYVDGCDATTVKVALPITTTPGVYRIRYDVAYTVPLKTVRLSNLSAPFTVTP
jgi:hypothetical protein